MVGGAVVVAVAARGRLTFVCEWPAAGIVLTRTDLDAAPIRDAAARSRTLWDHG